MFKKLFSKTTLINYLLIVFISIYSIIAFSYLYLNKPNTNLKNDIFIVVNKGDSFIKTSNALAKKKLISYPKMFVYIAKVMKGRRLVIKSGEYLFEKNAKPKEILQKLINGNVYYRKLTFSEGLSTHSILQIIDKADGLIGELPKDVEEGVLLPETYLYTKGETKTELINRMKQAMNKTLNDLWTERDTKIPIKTKKEALILASIVEKETGLPEERGQVASVFINRLKIRMKLQSDPTVVYAFTKGNKNLERIIRKSDLKRKSPYNTYHVYGLPPSPIANPSKEAIKAVLNPPKTDYLFFVATGNGGHNFSKNVRDHVNFVKKYRKVLNSK